MLDWMGPLIYFNGFQIFLDGWILRAITLEAFASVGFVDVWKVKVKAKGRVTFILKLVLQSMISS